MALIEIALPQTDQLPTLARNPFEPSRRPPKKLPEYPLQQGYLLKGRDGNGRPSRRG